MRGAIAAGSDHAANAGAAMFRLGGNAVDAAVAAAWVSCVVEMTVVNIGGGGYGTIWTPDDTPHADFFDFFCEMPSGRTDQNLDFHRVEIDFGPATQSFHIGRGSTAVPGLVSGLCAMVKKHGRLPLEQTLKPAIALARGGFEVPEGLVRVLEILAPIFADTPEMKAELSRGGAWIRPGDRLSLPALAKTFADISSEGPESFYKGSLAAATVADHARFGGLIQARDLASYQTQCKEPNQLAYGDGILYLPAYSSLGGRLTGFTFGLLASQPLNTYPRNSPEHLRLWAHALRLTSMARGELEHRFGQLGAGVSDQFENLLENYRREYNRVLREPGTWHDCEETQGPSHTSHISAMDASGFAISLTHSAGESAGYLITGTGMPTNNILGEEDLNPNGWHKHLAGHRLVSMMSPILYCQAGRPRFSLGSAGSNRLRSAIVQTLSYAADFGLELNQAVNSPRMHYENGILNLEPGFSEEGLAALKADGFQLKCWQDFNLFFGGAQAVGCDGEIFEAGADRRRGGAFTLV